MVDVTPPRRIGDLRLHRPYTLLNDTGMTGEFFRTPHSALALPDNMIRKACAVSLSPGHPLTSLINDYLRRLAADPTLFTAPNADLVGHPRIELVRALIATHIKSDDVAAQPLAATLPLCILEYASNNLTDPGRWAEQIAAAHYISVRYLYKVLAEGGIGLADWIRTHRSKRAGTPSPDPHHNHHRRRRQTMRIHRHVQLQPHLPRRIRTLHTRMARPQRH